MSLTIILAMSVASVAAVLLTASRVFGFNRVVRYGVLVDVVFTAGALVVFAGTITGTLVAVLSGLLMALFLSAMKWVSAATTPKQRSKGEEFNSKGEWVYNTAPYI